MLKKSPNLSLYMFINVMLTKKHVHQTVLWLCLFWEFWENLPPSRQAKSKSFLNVQEAVKDSLKLLKLYYFSFTASLMEPYLLAYQTHKPMIPFMCNDLENLSKNLLKLFIKPEVIDKCTSPKQLK